MKREMFLAVTGVIGVLFGLGFLLMPDMSLRTYGVPTEPHNLMQARYFGATLMAFGLVSFLARNSQDAVAFRALLVGGVVGNGIGAVISAMAAGSLQNGMAWMSVVLYGAFALAGAYYLMGAKPHIAAQAG